MARQEEEAWQGVFSYSGFLRSIKETLGPEGRDISWYLWLPLRNPQELIGAICPPGLLEEQRAGNWVHASGWPRAKSNPWAALFTGRPSVSVKWE